MTLYPKISIVTPSFNQGNYLEDTLLSVLGQCYPNLEYIVIDGGSTDQSVGILDKYTSKLSYWTSERDNGQAEAINKGFAKATGDIFMWINSDDMLMPNVLFTIAQNFITFGDKLYIGNSLHFRTGNGGITSWGSNIIASHSQYQLKEVDYIIQPSSFWSSKVWHTAGPLKTDLHYAFDWEWFLHVSEIPFGIQCVEECLSLFRYHQSHKSANGGNVRRDEIESIYNRYYPDRAVLYKLLRQEDNRKYYLKDKLIKKYLTMFNKPVTRGVILRAIDRKYHPYSAKEIDDVWAML